MNFPFVLGWERTPLTPVSSTTERKKKMETIGYMIMGTACAFLVWWMGWTVGCWFTESEMARRQLEQERAAARNRAKAKSKRKVR